VRTVRVAGSLTMDAGACPHRDGLGDHARVTSPLRDSYAPALLAFLRDLGADRVRHSQRTLLDHLVGTAVLLERWGADDDVCKAGLFHSIYGTEYFHRQVVSFDDRLKIRERVGERAERLAYIFCRFDRRSIYSAIAKGEPFAVDLLDGAGLLAITKRELVDLVWLVWSNAVEQVSTHALSEEGRIRSLRAIARCRPLLSRVAVAELWAAYHVPPPP
jgi:hypothetical protein